MKRKLLALNRNLELITANSSDYELTDSDQLPGGVLTGFQGTCTSTLDMSKTVKDKLRKWTSYQSTNGKKIIVIILLY